MTLLDYLLIPFIIVSALWGVIVLNAILVVYIWLTLLTWIFPSQKETWRDGAYLALCAVLFWPADWLRQTLFKTLFKTTQTTEERK